MQRLVFAALLWAIVLACLEGCGGNDTEPQKKTGRSFDRLPRPTQPKQP
jgi:hypothetical protein